MGDAFERILPAASVVVIVVESLERGALASTASSARPSSCAPTLQFQRLLCPSFQCAAGPSRHSCPAPLRDSQHSLPGQHISQSSTHRLCPSCTIPPTPTTAAFPQPPPPTTAATVVHTPQCQHSSLCTRTRNARCNLRRALRRRLRRRPNQIPLPLRLSNHASPLRSLEAFHCRMLPLSLAHCIYRRTLLRPSGFVLLQCQWR
mmetsp:Transcript_19354/g.28891  ORF Transcript_19354/g.28891 Transcript_19354/m.28891 type:complete len:204 (+) Transcript_19354:368-979(+)